jgi:hypothetical protein
MDIVNPGQPIFFCTGVHCFWAHQSVWPPCAAAAPSLLQLRSRRTKETKIETYKRKLAERAQARK